MKKLNVDIFFVQNLESELKKIQGSIVESMSTFDELLNNLFQKHIQVVKTIHQVREIILVLLIKIRKKNSENYFLFFIIKKWKRIKVR